MAPVPAPRPLRQIMVSFARRAALLCVAGLLATFGASAQTPTLGSTLGMPRLPSVRSVPTTAVALEGAVDANRYIVGPGDVFSIVIGGLVPREITATVSADGRLIIAEAGAFQADGRTLAAVRADVLTGLRQQVRNVTADVVLARPRQFYVHVSGAVPAPGRHLVRPVARVEDAIAEAVPETALSIGDARSLANYGSPVAGFPDRRPALRNVMVRGERGELRVDLMRYFATGDTDANPYLRDGDTVVVPRFDVQSEGIFVGGAVDRPAVYDARPDDTAYDLLVVATSADPGVERVRIVHNGEPSEVSLAESRRVRVVAGDQVYAVEANPDAASVEVNGAVRYPGVYAAQAGETSLADLIRNAGGLLPTALPRAAYIVRTTTTEPTQGVLPVDTAGVALLTGLDAFGREYYTQEFLRPSRVSVDLAAALAGNATVPLRDGDRIVIPEDLGSVRVFGQVNRPGYVPYAGELAVSEYVTRAGGQGPDAADAYLVEAGTGRLIADLNARVQAGDAVFVSRDPLASGAEFAGISLQEQQLQLQRLQAERDEARLDLENQRDRRAARFQLLQTTITAVATLTTVVLTIATLNRTSE